MRPSSLSVRSLEGRPRRALHGAACLVDRRHVSSPRIGDGSINLPQREGDFLLFQLTKQVHHKKSRDGGITPHERIRRDSFHPGVTSSDSRRKKEFYLSRVSYLNDRQEEVSHDRLFRRYAIDSSVFNPVISSPSSSPCSSHPSQPSSSKDFMRRSFCPTRDLSFPSLFSPCDVLSSSPLHYAPFNHSFKHRSLLSRSIRLSFLSFSSLPSTSSSSSSSSGCRRRPRDSSRSDVEGVGRERNTSRKLPLSSSSSSPVSSSSSSVSSPFSYVSKTVVRNDGDEGERTTGSRFQYRGRLAGGIASASLLLALAFRKWAQEQEEKRKGMWWLSSSSPSSSSSSLSSLSGHSSSSFSSAFEDRPAQPHPFIPVEDSCKSTPHQVANLPPSGVYTPEQSSEDDTILEGIRTFLSPLGPVDLSSSSVSLSSLSPVNQLATSLAVSLSSRFKKLSRTPPFPQGGETSSTEKREEGAAYQQEDPGKPREGKEESDYDESTRKDAFELLRNILYGRPVRVETLGDLEEEEDEEEHDEGKERRKDERRKDSCIVQLHDCRVLASKEGRMALEEILKATGTIDLTATEYEGLDDEDRKAWDVIKGGNDKTVMELWQSAAFRKIVETWRRQAFKEGFVGDVLEIGIGKGKTMGDPDLQKSCCSYTGIDVRLLDEAKQNAVEFSSPPNHNNHRHPHASSSSDLPFPITLLEADAQNLPFPPDSFDCAVSQRVLCSVESPPCVISSVLRVLRPGGRMVFFEHGSLHPSLSRELLSSASSSSSDSSRLHQKKETSDKQHESPRRKHMKRQGQAPGEEAKGDRERGVDEDEEEMDRTSPIRGQAWGTTVMNGLNSWIDNLFFFSSSDVKKNEGGGPSYTSCHTPFSSPLHKQSRNKDEVEEEQREEKKEEERLSSSPMIEGRSCSSSSPSSHRRYHRAPREHHEGRPSACENESETRRQGRGGEEEGGDKKTWEKITLFFSPPECVGRYLDQTRLPRMWHRHSHTSRRKEEGEKKDQDRTGEEEERRQKRRRNRGGESPADECAWVDVLTEVLKTRRKIEREIATKEKKEKDTSSSPSFSASPSSYSSSLSSSGTHGNDRGEEKTGLSMRETKEIKNVMKEPNGEKKKKQSTSEEKKERKRNESEVEKKTDTFRLSPSSSSPSPPSAIATRHGQIAHPSSSAVDSTSDPKHRVSSCHNCLSSSSSSHLEKGKLTSYKDSDEEKKTPIIEEIRVFIPPHPDAERIWTCVTCVAAST